MLKSLLLTALIVLLFRDALFWLINPAHRLPELHKEILGTGFLAWFISICFTRNNDDDWIGSVD